MLQIVYYFLLLVYGIVFFLFGYTLFCANRDGDGINGDISRFIYIYIPNKISKIISYLLGSVLYERLANVYDYVINKPNPIMQIIYLIALNGSFCVYLIYGAQKIPNRYLSSYHRYLAYVGVYLCHYSFYIACKTPPGVITHENIECFLHTDYDGLLYMEGYGCRTCRTPKVRYEYCY